MERVFWLKMQARKTKAQNIQERKSGTEKCRIENRGTEFTI